ncbi:MAG: DHHW family protein, partial [Oscillospiraceae bacterium]
MKNYYKKKLKSSSSVFEGGLLFVLIFGFITLFALINLIMPDREYSENENKYLAKSPKFTWATLVSGKFALDYETYVCEQFLLRDNWISAKSLSEFALLKVENNGVVYGKQGYMFPKFFSFDAERLNGNLAAIDAFAYECPAEVSVMIVPSAFYPLSEYVPRGLPHVDEGFYIDRINEYLSESAKPLDIEGALSVHANEYIYYRTDHHWTT